MMPITPSPYVAPIGSTHAPREQKGEGPPPSEELLAISAALKEALEGLSAWIQLYPLMRTLRRTILQTSEEEQFDAAARELDRLVSIFYNAHTELVGYTQQIPEPFDASIAYDMQKVLEWAFVEEIGAETACRLPGFGATSWGALLISEREVQWDPSMLAILFRDISIGSWRRVRQSIHSLRDSLP